MAGTKGSATRRTDGRRAAATASGSAAAAIARGRRRDATGNRHAQRDAIDLLKSDHRAVEELFARFEALGGGAHARKSRIVERISTMLSIHAGVEEMVFYPTIRRTMNETTDGILEALEEHHVVKTTLAELRSMTPDEERYDAKVTVLMENVRHHVREEERELFPAVRRRVPRNLLVQMHDLLESARIIAAQSPHPHAPDTPPANVALNAAMVPATIVGRAVKSALRRL